MREWYNKKCLFTRALRGRGTPSPGGPEKGKKRHFFRQKNV